MDLQHEIGLCVVMDNLEDLARVLLSIAGGMLEDAAALAPLSDQENLIGRIDRIEALTDNAGYIVKAARVIARTTYDTE